MNDSIKIKEFIRSKYLEIVARKYSYDNAKKEMLRKAEDIKNGSTFWINSINRDCVSVSNLHYEVSTMEFDLSQFVHVLGDEYVAYYESLKGKIVNNV